MSSSHNDTIVQPTIFREYIGGSTYPELIKFPAEMINSKVKEFHFILAFASEVPDERTKRGTGNFLIDWNLEHFGKQQVKDLKHAYPNVKVAISIGGHGDAESATFNPAFEIERWVGNATESLASIIKDFKNYCSCDLIDGIDIHYEKIESSTADFANYIGQLIQNLKNLTQQDPDVKITVASIAPSEPVKDQYMALYRNPNYGKLIDWVGYKFYQQKEPLTKDKFVRLYRQLGTHSYYSDKKLLAGFSTDPQMGDKITQKDFIDGCVELLGTKSLPGIFVWDAEHSSASEDDIDNKPYQFEQEAQQLLVDNDGYADA